MITNNNNNSNNNSSNDNKIITIIKIINSNDNKNIYIHRERERAPIKGFNMSQLSTQGSAGMNETFPHGTQTIPKAQVGCLSGMERAKNSSSAENGWK